MAQVPLQVARPVPSPAVTQVMRNGDVAIRRA